ncbi:hypothetical protein DPMN_008009 [Dreissena polymorpha]|uniref:Uncharacterized protein n=1 Tax=Dreissena polymorpha TaxID=45954 RepID=A0A9D4RYV5_DREPO|nr:hypothetical protein DPMN_008009 [Dreissena polymorpha]
MASRVLARKNVPPQDIIGTNLLSKLYDDRKINVTSKVLTRKNALPPWWPYIIGINLLTEKINAFQENVTIFELIQEINKTNLLTMFHEDWTINEKCPAPGGHVFQASESILLLFHDIIGMNLLTKFHEDWTKNVASRVKNAPPLGSHDFQANLTIFEFIQDIVESNLLIKFHEDWTINVASRFHDDRKINVASRVLTRKNAPPPCSHVFQHTGIIFELFQDIIRMNLLTKFHEDRTENVASRVLTRLYYSHKRKNAPPHGSHVFQANIIIFELLQISLRLFFLTKFHED